MWKCFKTQLVYLSPQSGDYTKFHFLSELSDQRIADNLSRVFVSNLRDNGEL